jgi:hypothetical protein
MKTKLLFLLLIFSLTFHSVTAQRYTNPTKYQAVIDKESLRNNLTVLASDEYEGRETGKKGQQMAAQYIAGKFESYGLKSPEGIEGYYQKIPLVENILAQRLLEVNQTSYSLEKDFYFSRDFNSSLEMISNEIVFAGYGIKNDKRDDYGNINIQGKVILVFSGEPTTSKGMSWLTMKNEKSEWSKAKYKIDYLRKQNPALILYVDENFKENSLKSSQHLKGNLKIEGEQSTVAPVIYISDAIANNLLKPNKKSVAKFKGLLDKTGLPNKAFILKSTLKTNIQFVHQKVPGENVLGYIEGSDLKDELLVITAHYDHIGIIDGKVYNGADDDASGTSAVIEMAKAFAIAKQNGEGPRRSILFMTFAGEEKGLLGSKYYSAHPVFPLKNTVANLNIDMIGRIDDKHLTDTNYVYIIGSDKLSTSLHQINEDANAKYTKLNLDYTYNDPKDPNRFYYRSDHYNFAKHNIPIIFYFNGSHIDYHQETDEISKISFDLLTKRTKLIFYTAWEIANRDERVKVDVQNPFPADR